MPSPSPREALVVRIWSFDCSGPGSVPDQGTEMLQAGLKKKKQVGGTQVSICRDGGRGGRTLLGMMEMVTLLIVAMAL